MALVILGGGILSLGAVAARAPPAARQSRRRADEVASFDHSIILESAARCFPLGIRVRLRARARLGEFPNRAHEKSSATTIRPTPSTSQPGRIISKSNALCSTLSGETLAWMPSAIASPMNVNAAITPLSAINIHVGGSLRVLRHQTSTRYPINQPNKPVANVGVGSISLNRRK